MRMSRTSRQPKKRQPETEEQTRRDGERDDEEEEEENEEEDAGRGKAQKYSKHAKTYNKLSILSQIRTQYIQEQIEWDSIFKYCTNIQQGSFFFKK